MCTEPLPLSQNAQWTGPTLFLCTGPKTHKGKVRRVNCHRHPHVDHVLMLITGNVGLPGSFVHYLIRERLTQIRHHVEQPCHADETVPDHSSSSSRVSVSVGSVITWSNLATLIKPFRIIPSSLSVSPVFVRERLTQICQHVVKPAMLMEPWHFPEESNFPVHQVPNTEQETAGHEARSSYVQIPRATGQKRSN